MKKRLPFEKPMISYEPVVNHILGIIASDYNNLQYALYNNFIEITYTNSVDYYGLRDWDRLDIFYSYRYPKEIKNAMDDEELKKLLIKWIDDDNYILVSFETYYINHYPTYKYNYFFYQTKTWDLDMAFPSYNNHNFQ